MKRWLLILLIALLPLQFSWAAVGAYCGDEHESQLEHAMHVERSASPEAGADSHSDAGLSTADSALSDSGLDCETHCHGHASCMPGAAPPLTAQGAGPTWLGETLACPCESRAIQPDRPQWLALA